MDAERIKLTEDDFVPIDSGFDTLVGFTIEYDNRANLVKQILDDHKLVENLRERWEKINVDLDAPEDCVKFCITFAHYIRDGRLDD